MQIAPSSELDTVLQEARRLRAAEMNRLARLAFDAVARLFQRNAPSRSH